MHLSARPGEEKAPGELPHVPATLQGGVRGQGWALLRGARGQQRRSGGCQSHATSHQRGCGLSSLERSKIFYELCPKQPPHKSHSRLQQLVLPPRGPQAPILLPPRSRLSQCLNRLFGNPGCSRLATALSLFNWRLNLLPAIIMRLVSPGSLRTVNYPCRPQPIRHMKSANCSH